MELRNLPHVEHVSDNQTSPGFAHLPTTVLDAFIPGYSFIAKYLLDAAGFDISIIVSVLFLVFASTTGFQYLYRYCFTIFVRNLSTSVTVDAWDAIYDNILAWAAEQEALKNVRSLRVQSAGENMSDDMDEIKAEQDLAEGAIFNFNNWAAKLAPRYEPHTGQYWFWHKGNMFRLERFTDEVAGWMGMMTEQEKLTITVVGRSTNPIKRLIVETREKHIESQTAKTIVRRPSPKEQRGRGRQAWNKVAIRPSRPMGTVVLDDRQKAMVLEDINDFLHPRTSRWYANRGIPYRRGYLFHGPPGTGKTSLSFALAGVFGLDIYCLSLSEVTMTEEDLILLFNSLPKRCVVLLEDIDTAGVLRKKSDSEEEEKGKDKGRSKSGKSEREGKDKKEDDATTVAATTIAKEVAKAVKSANDASESGRKGVNQGISLSGLLNAIDGVASQEGRVLVMTTNYPEKLDEALIRPGRVDLKIEFTLASKQQVRELFLRMYSADTKASSKQPTKLSDILPHFTSESNKILASKTHEKKDSSSSLTPHILQNPLSRVSTLPTPPMTPNATASHSRSSSGTRTIASPFTLPSAFSFSNLEKYATVFANSFEDGEFSPAEIQGFLVTRKKDPMKAVVDAPSWREEELKKKKKEVKKDEEKKAADAVEKMKKAKEAETEKVDASVVTADEVKSTSSTLDEKTEQKHDITVDTGCKSLIGTGDGVCDDDDDSDHSTPPSSAASEASEASVESVASDATM